MIKAQSVSVAVCNVGPNQLVMIVAVGEDGYVYQLINGKWDRFPALDAEVVQGAVLKFN